MGFMGTLRLSLQCFCKSTTVLKNQVVVVVVVVVVVLIWMSKPYLERVILA